MASKLPCVRSVSRILLQAAGVLLASLMVFAPDIVEAQADPASKFNVLHSFKGASGAYPLGGVITDSEGNLYGTTSEGGAKGNGTVFKLTDAGDEVVLHSFKGGHSDGAFPIASLVRDAAGKLYGTTTLGGAYGYGTVFQVQEDGDETLLHSFGERENDGRYPSAGLILDLQGNLYGTTEEGGAYGYGTIFKLEESGKETVLHSFAGNPSDGQYPIAGLIRDGKGNLYGTTEVGGIFNAGCVFKLEANSKESVLFSFTGMAGGGNPFGGVVQDAKGNLYGTTAYGANGYGVIFQLDPLGRETVLHSFTGGTDGAFPSAGLVRDAKGSLYGTAEFGGTHGSGVIFSVSTTGREHVLHSFDGLDGADILTSLVPDQAGNLYGTATEGGANGQGTVFKLSQD